MQPKPLDLNEEEMKKIENDINNRILPASELTEFIKQRIKQACEFYLKYEGCPEILLKEHQELGSEIVWEDKTLKDLVEEYLRLHEKIVNNSKVSSDDALLYTALLDVYNEWLFKLAFKDALENNEGGDA